MMKSAETKCVFDGNSRWCNDADITLEFDDGSTLMAHSLILCMASPVLETALKDCETTKKLRLRSVDKKVWSSILRELYPLKSDVQANIWSIANCDDVVWSRVSSSTKQSFPYVCVGKECRKYKIQSVLDSIDDLIVREMKKIPPIRQTTWNTRVGFYGKLATSLKLRRPTDVLRDYVVSAVALFGEEKLSMFKKSYIIAARYPQNMIEVLMSLFEIDDSEWTISVSLCFVRRLLNTNV